MNYIEKAAHIVPSKRQIEWQKTEFYAFVHFGVNTFTNREWGFGNEDPKLFNPTELDAEQWVDAVKAAGMKGLILTAKHHDGFCLWPSAYTDHSVKNSPWKNGKGDVVREVAAACKKGGIKFGVYLSPWDRHEPVYGDSEKYNQFYKNQLTELLTNYGELFSIWFDGACGEGLNGKKQVYDWQGYIEICNKLQPNAVQFNFGDVRWCGNEAGDCRKAEWSVVPRSFSKADFVTDENKKNSVMNEDLGSRDVIKNETDFIWYPCETDTSIRPGWFYHASEDEKVRSLDELLNIYYNSVGGNSTLLLNIPPDTRGLFHENDVKRLAEIGNALKKEFAVNLTSKMKSISATNSTRPAEDIFKGGYFESAEENVKLAVEFCEPVRIKKVVLMENINQGQRVEKFKLYVKDKQIYSGETIGYKKICCFEEIITDNLIVDFEQSRLNVTIRSLEIY